ncbi:hypothetical protein DAPPUDRAFT_223803 [Daphnia pulex]|uniref:Fe2OG dioxygenase domain-containing protein n=1 Tax=Daphnia pulex TaxID=6669 RepID=E9GDN0_DAPPU|nr:hypothetical protein DAPPUDRAFT_223803 [Daphnia pulex]|eukprot:EFX82448.1 hypothetical protein DAPPUDRAFT_223803 [Daphnia pulex]
MRLSASHYYTVCSQGILIQFVMPEIPVVDLSNMDLHKDRITNELDKAFSTVGFVYLKNHGIDQEKVDNLFKASRNFFQLPENVKKGYPRDRENFDGYTGRDQEILEDSSSHEVRESYDVTSATSRYPDDSTPEFRLATCELAKSLRQLTTNLLKFMAVGLGLDEDYLSSRHRYVFDGVDKNGTMLRSLYYPSLTGDDIQPGVVRCGEHSDYGTITLLLQDDMGGLEVLSGKEWVAATPIAGTVLVNLGDLMQFWTSDRYVATVHRVRVPELEIQRRSARQSIAFFVQPDNGVVISSLDGSGKHQPVESLSYLKLRLSEAYKY